MATLENIMQMKQQGFTEPQIIESLKQQGVAPNEINEALSQSKIKTELGAQTEASIPRAPMPTTAQPQGGAMSQPGAMPPPGAMPAPQPPTLPPAQEMPKGFATAETPTPETQMQPSMGTQPQAPTPTPMAPPSQPPQTEFPPTSIPSAMPPITQGYQAPMQEYPAPSPNDQMPYYDEYQPQQSSDIETINDIAEQIVEEKTATLKNQITNFTRFKDELILEVEKINERLSKIENTFNELQMAILGKIGEYGSDIQNISKEMHATQDSFSKIINPLTDNIRELQKMTGTDSSKSKPKPKTKKQKADIENYLR